MPITGFGNLTTASPPETEKVWFAQSLANLDELGDHRRMRLLSSQSSGVPDCYLVRVGGCGRHHDWLQLSFRGAKFIISGLMTAGLALTISLVLFSVLALERPFAGMTRVGPDAFRQVDGIMETWTQPGADRAPRLSERLSL
jgi:hypothetical protein